MGHGSYSGKATHEIMLFSMMHDEPQELQQATDLSLTIHNEIRPLGIQISACEYPSFVRFI